MATEQVQQLVAALERLNARVVELETRAQGGVEPGRRPRGGLVDKTMQPGVFDGSGYHNWAEDLVAIVGSKNDKIGEAMKWVETKGDTKTNFEEIALHNPGVTEAEVRELYVYLMHYLIGEPRIIAKGAGGDGVEAWRRLKARYDPTSETSQVNVLLQVLQPAKAKNVKDILPAIEKWEEGLRRQQTLTGLEPLPDGTKRALLIKICTAEVARHLQLNARHLDSYEKMRWEVMNFIQLINPNDPMAMHVDHLAQDYGDDYDEEQEIYYMHGEKGKAKGKGKSYGEYKGKGKSSGKGIKGHCWYCGEQGHRAAECPHRKGGKGKGKHKGAVNSVDKVDDVVADTGSIEVIDTFALDEIDQDLSVEDILRNVRRDLEPSIESNKTVG